MENHVERHMDNDWCIWIYGDAGFSIFDLLMTMVLLSRSSTLNPKPRNSKPLNPQTLKQF